MDIVSVRAFCFYHTPRMTEAQAVKLAKQIFDRFGSQIREAVKGTHIPAWFIAGLVANEAGKDRQGNIRREATRFEPHIYTRLKRVAENPRGVFNSIKHSHIKDATDASLRALAHSYEATQMMGYWVIILGCTLADLKNPDKHFFYTVKLLQLNGFPRNATEAQMDREMRQWNTGRETGKTYHANYVPNAQKIRAAYKKLEQSHSHRSIEERVNLSAAVETPVLQPATLSNPDDQTAGDSAPGNSNQPPNINGESKTEVKETVKATTDESGETKTEVSTETTVESFQPKNIPAFIPRFGKQWFLSVIPGAGLLSTWASYFAGLPPWMVFTIGALTGVALVLFIQMLIKHRGSVIAFITKCYETMADPTQNNLIPTPATQFVGQRRTELETVLNAPE